MCSLQDRSVYFLFIVVFGCCVDGGLARVILWCFFLPACIYLSGNIFLLSFSPSHHSFFPLIFSYKSTYNHLGGYFVRNGHECLFEGNYIPYNSFMQGFNLQLKLYNVVNILLWNTDFNLDSSFKQTSASTSRSSDLNIPSAFISKIYCETVKVSGRLDKGR